MTNILSDADHIDLVREADLDWHAGFPVGEEVNRYSTLIANVERAVVSRLAVIGGELPKARGLCIDLHSRKNFSVEGYTADQMHAHYARGVAAGMAQERARCVAVCDGLAEDAGDDLPPYVAGWQEALEAAEQAISKPANDEKEQTR